MPRSGTHQRQGRRARHLRGDQTEAEKRVWRKIRAKLLGGAKFGRQAPIDGYVVDFCSFNHRLIIDIDRGHHALYRQSEYDHERTRHLEAQGFRVVRFWNNEVIENLDGVLETIVRAARETKSPSP